MVLAPWGQPIPPGIHTRFETAVAAISPQSPSLARPDPIPTPTAIVFLSILVGQGRCTKHASDRRCGNGCQFIGWGGCGDGYRERLVLPRSDVTVLASSITSTHRSHPTQQRCQRRMATYYFSLWMTHLTYRNISVMATYYLSYYVVNVSVMVTYQLW